MYYTGIDLHKKTSFITTIDESGKVVFRRNLPNRQEHILDYFVNLDAPTKIVIEAMCSWHWLYDFLTAHNFNVVISNPLKTKAIASAKIKNDKVDSHMLAQLLRADLIATVHVCSLVSQIANLYEASQTQLCINLQYSRYHKLFKQFFIISHCIYHPDLLCKPLIA